jgi:hypothetical protein
MSNSGMKKQQQGHIRGSKAGIMLENPYKLNFLQLQILESQRVDNMRKGLAIGVGTATSCMCVQYRANSGDSSLVDIEEVLEALLDSTIAIVESQGLRMGTGAAGMVLEDRMMTEGLAEGSTKTMGGTGTTEIIENEIEVIIEGAVEVLVGMIETIEIEIEESIGSGTSQRSAELRLRSGTLKPRS